MDGCEAVTVAAHFAPTRPFRHVRFGADVLAERVFLAAGDSEIGLWASDEDQPDREFAMP